LSGYRSGDIVVVPQRKEYTKTPETPVKARENWLHEWTDHDMNTLYKQHIILLLFYYNRTIETPVSIYRLHS
jgi:hypothetical protein